MSATQQAALERRSSLSPSPGLRAQVQTQVWSRQSGYPAEAAPSTDRGNVSPPASAEVWARQPAPFSEAAAAAERGHASPAASREVWSRLPLSVSEASLASDRGNVSPGASAEGRRVEIKRLRSASARSVGAVQVVTRVSLEEPRRMYRSLTPPDSRGRPQVAEWIAGGPSPRQLPRWSWQAPCSLAPMPLVSRPVPVLVTQVLWPSAVHRSRSSSADGAWAPPPAVWAARSPSRGASPPPGATARRYAPPPAVPVVATRTASLVAPAASAVPCSAFCASPSTSPVAFATPAGSSRGTNSAKAPSYLRPPTPVCSAADFTLEDLFADDVDMQNADTDGIHQELRLRHPDEFKNFLRMMRGRYLYQGKEIELKIVDGVLAITAEGEELLVQQFLDNRRWLAEARRPGEVGSFGGA